LYPLAGKAQSGLPVLQALRELKSALPDLAVLRVLLALPVLPEYGDLPELLELKVPQAHSEEWVPQALQVL
jgi:hypothetical protein